MNRQTWNWCGTDIAGYKRMYQLIIPRIFHPEAEMGLLSYEEYILAKREENWKYDIRIERPLRQEWPE